MNSRQKTVQLSQLNNEKKTLAELKQVYKKASDDCAKKIADLSARKDMENLQSIIYQKQYQEAIKAQLDDALSTLQTGSYNTVSEFLGASYENGWFGTLYDLQGQGVPLIMPLDQKQIAKAITTDSKISKGLYTRLGEDTTKLKTSIRAELSRGIANGSSWNDVAAHIANGMNTPFTSAYKRTCTIARTEGHRVQQEAQYNCQVQAKNKGANIKKEWDATLDGKTRPSHLGANGQIVDVDEPFILAGAECDYPGNSGDPAEDCNCRCCVLQRASWALTDEEYTKMNGNTNELVRLKEGDFNKFIELAKGVYTEDKPAKMEEITINSNGKSRKRNKQGKEVIIHSGIKAFTF